MGVSESKVQSRPNYNFYDDYLRRCTAVWNEVCKLNEYLKSNQVLYKQIQNYQFVQNSRVLRKSTLHNFSEKLSDYLKPSTPELRLQLENELKNSWRSIEIMICSIKDDYKLHVPAMDKYICIPSPDDSSQPTNESSYDTLYSRMTWGRDQEILFLLMIPIWSNRYIRRYILEAVKDPQGRMGCFILSSASKIINTVSFESMDKQKRMKLGLPETPKLYMALFNFFGRGEGEGGDNYLNHHQMERITKCKKDGCIHPFHWRIKKLVTIGGGCPLMDNVDGNDVEIEFANDLLDLDNRLDMLSSLEMSKTRS